MQRFHILFILTMLLTSSRSLAQTQPAQPHTVLFPRFEFFGGYLDTGEAPYSDFKFTGFSLPGDFGTHHGVVLAVLRNFNQRLGIKGEFSTHFQGETFRVLVCTQTPCVPVAQTSNLNPRLYSFLGGPEVRLGNRSWRIAPFTHALAGVAHASATFKTSGGVLNFSQTTTETGLAMALGGGVDVRVARRFSLRTAVDFNPKWVGRDDAGARQVQKGLRLVVGALFH